MKFEGQVILNPSPYRSQRFRKRDKLLIEIIINAGKNTEMRLYYISSLGALDLTKNDKLKFTDFKSGNVFSEEHSRITINIYDAYTVETLRIDYEDIDRRYYNAVEKVLIYANGRALPAVKHHRKIRCPNPMGYEYSTIIKKEG